MEGEYFLPPDISLRLYIPLYMTYAVTRFLRVVHIAQRRMGGMIKGKQEWTITATHTSRCQFNSHNASRSKYHSCSKLLEIFWEIPSKVITQSNN